MNRFLIIDYWKYLISIIFIICLSCTNYNPVPSFDFLVSNGCSSGDDIYFILDMSAIYRIDDISSFFSIEREKKERVSLVLYKYNLKRSRGRILIDLSGFVKEKNIVRFVYQEIYLNKYKDLLFISMCYNDKKTGPRRANYSIYLFDNKLKEWRLFINNARFPRVSPDEKSIAFLRENEIWISDLDGSNQRSIIRMGNDISYLKWIDNDNLYVQEKAEIFLFSVDLKNRTKKKEMKSSIEYSIKKELSVPYQEVYDILVKNHDFKKMGLPSPLELIKVDILDENDMIRYLKDENTSIEVRMAIIDHLIKEGKMDKIYYKKKQEYVIPE